MFTTQQGDHWICRNNACRAEFIVAAPSEAKAGGNPRCYCGSEMIRRYVAPAVRQLHADEAEIFLLDPELSGEIRANRPKQSEP